MFFESLCPVEITLNFVCDFVCSLDYIYCLSESLYPVEITFNV